ncbi:hypothetical protein H6G26_17110 [Nostoc sp. FACHB-888]|nr:hypothetical protein [Nostoc sp. FACHB-888]
MHFSQWRIRIGSISLLGGVAEQRDKLRQALEATLLYEPKQRVADRRSC